MSSTKRKATDSMSTSGKLAPKDLQTESRALKDIHTDSDSSSNSPHTTGHTQLCSRAPPSGTVSQLQDSQNTYKWNGILLPFKLTNGNTLEKVTRWSEEVDFIIRTRDNNHPDPLGTHSTAIGKLPWPQVVLLYCERFGVNETVPANLNKRYHRWFDEYCSLNPTYPRSITYSPTKYSRKRARKVHAERGERDPDTGNGLQTPVECSIPEHLEWVRFYLTDGSEQPLGTCDIRLRDFRKSSRYPFQSITNYHTPLCERSMEVRLCGVKKSTVQTYIDCISPRKAKLTEYNHALSKYRNSEGEVHLVPVVSRIDWSFQATFDLYNLAVYLKDHYVCDLVLQKWREMFRMRQINSWEELVAHPILTTARLLCDSDIGDGASRFWMDVRLRFPREPTKSKVGIDILADRSSSEGRNTVQKLQTPPWDLPWMVFRRRYKMIDADENENDMVSSNTNFDLAVIAERLLRGAVETCPEAFQWDTKHPELESLRDIATKFRTLSLRMTEVDESNSEDESN